VPPCQAGQETLGKNRHEVGFHDERHGGHRRPDNKPDKRHVEDEKFVIVASSLGTVLEWYDFYLYAVLAPFFAALFFPAGNDTAALLSAFAFYAAGFLTRPFGALIFGRIGDVVGRKYTFLVTIMVMGSAPSWSACCRPSPASAGLRRSCSSRFDCCRASRSAANTAARRPMWRARASAQPRLRHELDPDHRDARSAARPHPDRAVPRHHGCQGLCRMGLAHSVPDLGHPADVLGLHPAPAE